MVNRDLPKITKFYNQQVFADTLRRIALLLVAVFVLDVFLIVFSNRKYSQLMRQKMDEKLAENEKLFNIVAQHSNRTLYKYDILTRRTIPWDSQKKESSLLSHLHTTSYSDEHLEENQGVMPESIAGVKCFFDGIHAGTPSGETNIHVKLLDGQLRWYHFKYSSLFEEGKPIFAILSVEDVTQRHEQELAYRRHVQSLESHTDKHLLYMESDLTADQIEKLSGQILSLQEQNVQRSHSNFVEAMRELKFAYEKEEEAAHYFSCENLLALYETGKRQLKSAWQVRFQDGTAHWLDTETTLIADPYNGNIKAFFRMADITKEYEKQQSVLRRADYDSMTGLLRRDVGEALIRKHLSARTEPGGILIALDLDDLKGINDTLGHAYGDKAITGIAKTLKSHFRKGDILIRSGGDEFMVFLPGAGKSVSSVELSVTALLRKLSAISIGDSDERTIHCSVGCAVELTETDTFDSLYQRADMALYHVKRNGKNNYAFFESAMLEDNYRFKTDQARPIVNDAAKGSKLAHLLDVVSITYPGIVLFNLTQNYFHILTVGSNVENVHAPDKVDVFWENWRKNIHPDDQENTISTLSRKSLLSLYTQGQRSMYHYYQNLESTGYVRTEIAAQLYTTDEGDICAFLFFRWETAPEKDLEIQRLHKIVELSGKQDFEYICLIDVRDKSYSTFSTDASNSLMVPESADFDAMTKYICDTQIPPEKRSAYRQNAALEHILPHMRGPEDSYSYRYTTIDGVVREAVFNWYEDSHTELLMTIRKIG